MYIYSTCSVFKMDHPQKCVTILSIEIKLPVYLGLSLEKLEAANKFLQLQLPNHFERKILKLSLNRKESLLFPDFENSIKIEI